MPNTIPDNLNKELKHVYTYHPPRGNQVDIYYNIRTLGREFAEVVARHCPDCREREKAFERIEEAVMWANAGIARRT